MTKDGALNFFAGVIGDDDGLTAERIMVTTDLQDQLNGLFAQQADDFVRDDWERVDYQPKANYRLEREEIFVIDDVDLPMGFSDAIMSRHQAEKFTLSDNYLPRIQTIFGAEVGNPSITRVLFQQFRSTQLLGMNKLSMLLDGSTFRKLEESGLSLAPELAAIWQNKRLMFRSFAAVSRFFDLDEFQPKATETEIAGFVEDGVFAGDEDGVIFQLIESDSWLQRRIAHIVSLKILKKVKPRKAANLASAFGIEIPLKKVGDTFKIALPENKKELKRVIKFLAEEYFHG